MSQVPGLNPGNTRGMQPAGPSATIESNSADKSLFNSETTSETELCNDNEVL